jgi:hypothetical protein
MDFIDEPSAEYTQNIDIEMGSVEFDMDVDLDDVRI